MGVDRWLPLLWAWGLAASIDRNLRTAGIVFLVCGALTLYGLMHSPLEGNRLFLPMGPEGLGTIVLAPEYRTKVFEFAAGYAVVGVMLLLWQLWLPPNDTPPDESEADLENGMNVDDE